MREPSTALPSAWIERIFARLLTLYGRRFAEQWGVVDPAELKASWARDLADLRPEELAAGLERCRDREWPPTLPEFRRLCRPVSEAEAAFVEAALRWPSREGWSEPAIYWAAARLGSDVRRLSWKEARARWTAALEAERANPRPVPDPVPVERQLAAPTDGRDPKEVAAEVMERWRAMRRQGEALH